MQETVGQKKANRHIIKEQKAAEEKAIEEKIDLLPLNQIPGTDDPPLFTGRAYRVRSANKVVLDDWSGATPGFGQASQSHDNGDYHNRVWQLIPYENYYLIKSINNVLLDDWGGKKTGRGTASLATNNGDNAHRRWSLNKIPNKQYYKIKSPQGVILDDYGGITGKGTASLCKDFNTTSNHADWQFVPAYHLKLVLTDFEYDPNIDEILRGYKQVEFMDEHVVNVDEGTVGSTISRVFRKIVTDSFSWGLNQSIGIGVSVESSAGIPFIGGIKTTVTTTTEFSSNQQWSSSQTYDIEAHAQMTPNKPGTYKMSGFVEMANDVQLQFRAKGVIRGYQMRLTSGVGYVDGAVANGLRLLHVIRQAQGFDDAIIIQVQQESVQISVTGTMRGTYGMSTVTDFKQIA